jgi:hypothetical protein
MDVESEVASLDEFRDDEDTVIRVGGSRESKEEDNIGMARFLHQAPFTLEVL